MSTRSRASTIRHVVGSGIAGGLLGLLPIGRLRGWGKAAFIGLPAALVLGVTVVFASRLDDTSARKQFAGAGAAAAAAIAVSQWLGHVIDRAAEGFLRRRDTARPRAAIAVASGIATAGLALLDNDAETADRRPSA